MACGGLVTSRCRRANGRHAPRIVWRHPHGVSAPLFFFSSAAIAAWRIPRIPNRRRLPRPRRHAAPSLRQLGPPSCHGASAGACRQAGPARRAARRPRPRRTLQPRRAQEGPCAGMRRPPSSPVSPLSRRLSLPTPTQHRQRAAPHPWAAPRAAVAACCRPPVTGDGQPLGGRGLWARPRRRRRPRWRRGQRTTRETAAVQRWAKIGGGGAWPGGGCVAGLGGVERSGAAGASPAAVGVELCVCARPWGGTVQRRNHTAGHPHARACRPPRQRCVSGARAACARVGGGWWASPGGGASSIHFYPRPLSVCAPPRQRPRPSAAPSSAQRSRLRHDRRNATAW